MMKNAKFSQTKQYIVILEEYRAFPFPEPGNSAATDEQLLHEAILDGLGNPEPAKMNIKITRRKITTQNQERTNVDVK